MTNNWTDSIQRRKHLQQLEECKEKVIAVELDKMNENKSKSEQKSFIEILENARKKSK